MCCRRELIRLAKPCRRPLARVVCGRARRGGSLVAGANSELASSTAHMAADFHSDVAIALR
jgi:hypothetical protein